MSRINRVPKGLQDFLGNTNFGDNPTEFSSSVLGTIDMEAFYQIDLLRRFADIERDITGPATYFSLAVPEGRVWLLRSLAVRYGQEGAVASSFLKLYQAVTPILLDNEPVGQSLQGPVASAGADSIEIADNNAFTGAYVYNFPRLIPVQSGQELQFLAREVTLGAGVTAIKVQNFVEYFDLKA